MKPASAGTTVREVPEHDRYARPLLRKEVDVIAAETTRPQMVELTRSERAFMLALPVGSTIGGVVCYAESTNSFAEFLSMISSTSLFAMCATGTLFGLLPYIFVAVPACRVLERNISSAITRTATLALGGAGIGMLISTITIDLVIDWATSIGGFTGFALGILRWPAGRRSAGADAAL